MTCACVVPLGRECVVTTHVPSNANTLLIWLYVVAFSRRRFSFQAIRFWPTTLVAAPQPVALYLWIAFAAFA